MVYVAPWDRKEENNIGSSAIPSAQQMQQQQYVAPWDRQPKEQIQETRLSVPETIELPDKKVGMIQAVKDIASNIFSNKSDATGVSQGIGPTLDIGKTISEKKLREQNILTSDIKDKEGAALRATPVVSPTLDIGKVSSAQKQAEFERSILSGEASKATFNEMFAKNPIVAPVLEGIEADLDAGKRLSPEDAYMARTFGIIKSADNTGNRFMSNIRAGTGGLAASMGGALKRFGAKEIGEELQRRGETTAATWAQANPTLLDDVIQSLPFTLSLMPTMLIGGGIGVGLGSRLGLNTLGKSILGSFTSAGMSRPLESILEAGGAYNEALGRDFNVAKAEKVFNEVFSKNMLLGFMDFSEILLSFTPWGRIAVKSPAAKAILKGGGKAGDVTRLISKLGLVGVQEGMEEVFQEKFETEALGDEFDWTGAETVRAGTVGAIYGIGMGAAGAAFHGLNNSIMNRMKAQQIESFNVLTDHYKNQGMTDELAVLKALNGLAETEEGKNIIKAALPEAIESFNAGAAEVALTDELLPQKEEALSSGEVLQDERVKSDEKLTEAAATIPTEAAVQKTESKEAQQEEIDIDDIIELQAETGAVADINAGERYRLKNLGEVEVIDASDPSRVIVKNRHGNEIVLNRKIFEGLQQETLQRAHSSDFDVQQEQPYNKGKDITDKVGVKDVAGIQKRGQVSIEKILLDLEKSVSQRISSKLPDGTRVYELVADETKGKKEARDLQAARQIAELFGHQFAHIRVNPELKNSNPEAYDLANSFNGANIDGTIVINADRTNPAHAVVGHEITHEIAKDKELYEDFIGIIKGLTTEKGHDAVQGLIDAYKESGLAISEEQAWEEFAGDFVAEQMTKKDFWDKLAARSPSVAQKAIDVIKKIIAYIRRSIAPGDTVSQFIRDLELAQDIAVDAVARYLDKSTLSKAESLMANADKSFLAEVSRKGTTLATVISNTQDSINNKINETVDLLKEDIRRGEPGKRIMVDEKGTNEAYSSKWVGIPSTHAKWYRDFWAMYKRKPSNKNLKEIALDWLRNGVASDETFSSQGQEIPADGEFLELEAFLSELQRIDDALAKGYESAEAANEAANIKDVKRDKGDAGYSADIRYSAKRKAAGETSEGTTKEGTTGQQLSFDFNSDMGRKVEQLEFNFPEIRGKEATKNAAKAIVEIEQQQKAQSDISAATTGREADHHESEGVRSSDIRTVARGYTKRLLNNGGINLIGEKIKSPEELAVMAQVLRDPRFETFRMFFTKTLPGGSKEIVYHTGVTSRVPGASRAHLGDTPSKRAKYMVDVLTYAINSGADGYYFMHNHPSGDPKPSRGDITVTRIEAGRITPRLKYEGHIIINSNKYAYMGPNDISSGRYEIYELKGLGKDKLLSPDVPHPMLGIIPANDKGVITPQAIFGLASQYKAKDGYSVLYYMAPNFRIKGIQEILSTNIADIDNFKAWLREQAVDFGGHHVILIAEDLHTYKKAAQLIKEGYLVDVISIENGHSAQEQGRVAPPPDDDNIWMGEKLEAVATWEREGTWGSENPDILFQLKKVAPKGVNSPAFKKWFGDSIVTIDGKPGNEPLVVYHNTNKEFSIFDISKARQSQDIPGFFFSSNKTDFKDMGNKQIQAYLSIQNPYTGNYANYKGIKGASTDSAFKEIRNALIEDGYDGIVTKDDDSAEYIAFYPNQIKSVDNRGTWDSGNPDIRYQLKKDQPKADPFYSKLERTIEAKMPKQTSAAQVLAIVDNPQNVRTEEVKWSGIRQWLQSKGKGKVVKEEVLEFLRGNRLQIEEITRKTETEFAGFTLPGGENYRELLFVLPSSPDTFRSSHWDEPNVLAHTRFNKRTTPDGKNVFFIEEIQSDWHQEGRKKGYKTEVIPKDITSNFRDWMLKRDYPEEHIRESWQSQDELYRQWDMEQKEYYNAVRKERHAVPDAPFRKTWHEFVLKRLIRLAAENNFDYMAWTTGGQQAERYNLNSQVGGIQAYRNYKDGKPITDSYQSYVVDSRGYTINSLSHGNMTGAQFIKMFGKDLGSRLIDGANKAKGHRFEVSGLNLDIGGEGMKAFYDIGGKSSQNIPSFLNKYVKQWGSKVEEITLGKDLRNTDAYKSGGIENVLRIIKSKDDNARYTLQPAIRITEGMKKSALYEGQPLFQLKIEGGRWTQAGTKTESVEAKTAVTKETSKTATPDPFAGETPPSQKLGIVDSRFNSNVKLRGKKEISFDSHAFQNEDVEAEYRRSYGVTKRTLSQKAKEGATEFWHMFTRQMRKIDPKDSKNAVFIKEMTLYPKMMQMSGDYANRMIYKYIKDLGKKRFNIFRRTVLLKDLMEEVSLGHELPGEWTSEIVQDELARIQPKIDHLIQEAIDKRIAGNKKIVDDFLEAMKGIGVNLDSKFTRENYFRHQVLYFMNIQEYQASKGAGEKVRGKTSYGWLKERKGSKLSINTNYLEAESEVLSQMKYQTELAKMLKRLDDAYNIKDECVNAAKKATEEKQADDPDASTVSWRKMIPEGYRIWQPIEGRHFYMVNAIPDKLADDLVSGVLSEIGISQEDIRQVLAVGQKKKEYVLPVEIVDTLDHIDTMQPDNIVFQVIKDTLSIWKGWHLTDNPRSMIKYNIRNVSGDLDGTLGAIGFGAVKPQLINRAVRELYDAMWHMNFSKDMQEWWEAGGFQTLLYAQEIGDVSHLKPFRRLEDAKGLLDRAIRVPMTYLEFARDLTNYREGILRYSAYLFYKDHLEKNGGKPKFYGASIPATVDGLTTIKDKAFQLSNDALGAYDQITEFGRILRQYLIPFHSWNEINFKRYKRIFANIMTNESLQKNAGEKFTRTLGLSAAMSARTAMLLGRVVLRASLFASMLILWNSLWPEEEDDLPKEVRNKPHIILGRAADGDVIYFSRLGALVDLLDWVGLDTLGSDLQEISEGKRDLGEQVEDMLFAIPDNIVSSLTPFLKTPLEIISGQTYFPEVRTPRKIRDKGEYAAQSMNLAEEYKRLAGKPVKYSYADSWARAVIYKASPSESAYYYSMDLKRKFEEKVQGKVPSSGFSDTPRSKALYYFKQSLKFKEPDKAYRYISDYFANGGTAKGIVLSLQTMDPLYGLDKKEQQQYYDWLTEKDRKKVKDGLRYYHDTVQYNPRNKAEKKIYGHIENVLLSNAPEEIKEKEMMNVIKAMMD